jgi:hypothetical protein
VYWWQVARINTSFGFPQTLSEALKMENQQNKIQKITSKIKNQKSKYWSQASSGT